MTCDHFWMYQEQPCGCGIDRCANCDVAHKVLTCERHTSLQAPIPEKEYYLNELGCFVNGIPLNKQYIRELQAALAAMRAELPIGDVLEIGAGNGRLIPYFLRRGCTYEAVEVSAWACSYIRECFDVVAQCGSFMNFGYTDLDLVVAFHSLEHIPEAPQAFEKISASLKSGGKLLYCGPDGTDLVNPDHLWFWNEQALRSQVEGVGLRVESVFQTSITPHEDSIYMVAVK